MLYIFITQNTTNTRNTLLIKTNSIHSIERHCYLYKKKTKLYILNSGIIGIS